MRMFILNLVQCESYGIWCDGREILPPEHYTKDKNH